MLAVGALAVALRGLHELAARDPVVLEGDLLHDRDRQVLRPLYGAHAPDASTNSRKEKHCQNSMQALLSSVLTLLEFCAFGRIQRNILSRQLLSFPCSFAGPPWPTTHRSSVWLSE